ncbi:MAG: hypothetical protein ACJ75B_10985 [Flavisolibacter sp.]
MRLQVIFIVLASTVLLGSCKKDALTARQQLPEALSYGDSVFFLKTTAYQVQPIQQRAGTYSAYPDNLQIDPATGAITVSLKGKDGQSQTGLRYKILFKAENTSETDSCFILVSGINYLDKFYYLSQNDSLIRPIYNADLQKSIPSGNYDMAHDNKLSLNPADGEINIKETVGRGFFNDLQPGKHWKQLTIKYSAGDQSNSVVNSMDIILYYYNSINDVPRNVSALMQAHQTMMVGLSQASLPSTFAAIDNNLSSDLSLSKPRPPCVVIIGH